MNVHHKGFTLIEILVVMSVLSILFGITLTALNPFEQLNKTKDVSKKATIHDLSKTIQAYYAQNKSYPWETNSACSSEMTTGGEFSELTSCFEEITGRPSSEFTPEQLANFREIHVSECQESAVMCYIPKSKQEIESPETKYDKFGVVKPGCPGNSPDDECYWCKPVSNKVTCESPDSPTPPQPEYPILVPGYANDETKLFRTRAVFLFDYPGFPPGPSGWSIHLSTRPDFGGDYTETHRSIATASNHSHTTDAPSWTAYHQITDKYVAYQAFPQNYPVYANNCGETVYWRAANYYSLSAENKLEGPTYTGVIDCDTIVGVVSPPISWYTVYDQLNNVQKEYIAEWDFDNSGNIDWIDYWLGSFSTKFRSGGWQPPE